MFRINISCPKCRGPVWEDIESAKHIDMACIYCGKRWHLPKQRYIQWKRRKEQQLRNKKFKPSIVVS